ALSALPSLASDMDLSEKAKRRMHLDFDMDEVAVQLDRPAPVAPPRRSHAPPPVAMLPLEPNSEIRTVTVFRDRAQVTRHLKAQLNTGMHSVTFEGLPLAILQDSLQAGLDSSSARIVGVELVSAHGEVDDGKATEAIRVEAKGISDQLGQVRDAIEALLAQRSYLRSTLLQGQVQGQSRPGLAEVRSALDYVGKAEATIAGDLRVQEERAKKLGDQLMPLLVKLKNPLASGQKVRVELDVQKSTNIDIALQYQVLGASWTPSYNARLTTKNAQVELEVQGVVQQRTAEAWTDVDLYLSTANPSQSGVVPKLQPWFLGRDNNGGDFALATTLTQGEGRYDNGGHTNAKPVAGQGMIDSDMQAAIEGSGAVVFHVKGQRSIRGDGSSQRIPVGTQTLATRVELAAVPKLMPEVYRRAHIQYEGNIPLLPGPIASYVDGDYVGSGQIAAVVPGEEFSLSFGTEERIKVARVMVARKQEFLGMGRRTARYTFHFRVQVHNFTGSTQRIEISDQLPVSELDRVIVKIIDVSHDGRTEQTDSQGSLTWNMEVVDGGTRSVDFRFSVTGPTDTPQLRQLELMF
ncbi:MAG: hypothetical protein ACI9MC_003996, partial [Kiritimatiellia bacterium]